ncbi:MAG: site-2 protease family protein [Candidatus Diapherotrites archaeon]|nr:site-2 protease family protein [Candidatus Diapherotrites archaeon]
MEPIEMLFWALAILVFLLLPTFLFKRFTKSPTFYFGTIFKTTRFLPLFDKFAKYRRFLNLFADIGLVLGFGAIGVDYLIGRKQGKKIRLLLFFLSAFFLFEFFILFFEFLLTNPFIEKFNLLLSLGFAVMGFAGFLFISLAAYAIFIIESAIAGEQSCPGVAPIIPGLEIPKIGLQVPLHGWISILIILVLHEGMHGVLMRKAKAKIKSAGVLLLGLFPIGAFVEPDEPNFQKIPEKEQLRVYAAGPMANIITSPLIFLVALFFSLAIVNPLFGPFESQEYDRVVDGVVIATVDQNIVFCGRVYEGPAFGKLEPGMLVKKINGKDVENVLDLGREITASGVLNPFTITVEKDGAVEEVTIIPTEMGSIGFKVMEKKRAGQDFSQEYNLLSNLVETVTSFLRWFFLLSLVVGMVNFLPMSPFDGGKIAKVMLLPYFGFLKMSKEDTEKFIGRLFLWILLILLALNALPFFL